MMPEHSRIKSIAVCTKRVRVQKKPEELNAKMRLRIEATLKIFLLTGSKPQYSQLEERTNRPSMGKIN